LKNRPIITLTSDWGTRSHYAGAVKGVILSQIHDAHIVDISHEVNPFDIMQASFILKNASAGFPEESIHLIGVNTEASIETPHIVARANKQYYIGADNGIFSLLFDKPVEDAVELNIIQSSSYFTFSTRDVFVKAARMITSGTALKELGTPYKNLNQRFAFKPVIYDKRIIGKVIYIDDYENVYANIDHQTFRKVGKNKKFFIGYRSDNEGISRISTSYSDVLPGEKLALFGTTGFLEIAVNQGNASSLLGITTEDTITIEFFE